MDSQSLPIALRIERDGKMWSQSVVSAKPKDTFLDIVQQVVDLRQECLLVESVFAGAQSFNADDLFRIEATSTIENSIIALGTCTKVLCCLKSEFPRKPTKSNVFETMMANANELKLPEERPAQDGRSAIHNHLIAYLKHHGVGFRVFQKGEMDLFMTTVVAVLWQLDGHWSQFATASNVKMPPKSLHFVPADHENYRVLCYGTQKKKVLPQLKLEELAQSHDRLVFLSTKKFIQTESWEAVRSDILLLQNAIADYMRHMTRSCDIKEVSRSLELNIRENRVLRTVPPTKHRDEITVLRYKQLDDALSELPEYSDLNIVFFAPTERRMKYKYITGLQLAKKVQLYRSFRPNGTFIWRAAEVDDPTAAAQAIAAIEQNLENRIKEDKFSRLNDVYGSVSDWTPQKVQEFACAATDDEGVPDDSSHEGYKLLLQEGYEVKEVLAIESDAEISSQGKFKNFWEAAEKVLAVNDYAVADERRHGETSWISPICLSLSHLMRECETEMERAHPHSEDNFVPSYEYFRLQFVPRNLNSNVAKRYYGRFDIKFGLQKRTLHKSHVDQHFGAKQFQYLKVMAGKYSEHSVIFFLDDKASIPIGFENAPVSATRRQKKVLMAGLDQRGLNAMDHDNIPQHIVPSVAIRLIPPKELNSSWYGGRPTITLKDAIFEPSTAFRHAAELLKNMTLADYMRPIMFFGTDGGPDHNVTSIQVILSYIALFFELDLDFLVAVRTPPNFSVINPAERFMSVANIALVGVSLARNSLGKNDKKVKSFMSKKQWRDAQEKHQEINYRQLALDGTKDARELLTKRFQKLTYKGENVLVGEPATMTEIDELKNRLVGRWPELDFSKPLLKANVLSIPSMQTFLNAHARFTKYAFQLKKCDDDCCEFHDRRRLSFDVFETLKWLPSPELVGDHFTSFEDVYGREPTDKDVPSVNVKSLEMHSHLPKAPFPLAHTRVRVIVRCTECNFPRLLYAKYGLDKNKLARIEQYFEEKLFVCGSILEEYPELFQNRKLTCGDPISLHYYQAGPMLEGFVPQCAKCLSNSVTLEPNKTLLCSSCSSNEQIRKPAKQSQKRGKGRPRKEK